MRRIFFVLYKDYTKHNNSRYFQRWARKYFLFIVKSQIHEETFICMLWLQGYIWTWRAVLCTPSATIQWSSSPIPTSHSSAVSFRHGNRKLLALFIPNLKVFEHETFFGGGPKYLLILTFDHRKRRSILSWISWLRVHI